jgi:hypothetical protein
VQVSVERRALTKARYPSLIDGLDDVGLRRIEMDMNLSCEVPRLDGAGSVRVSIGSEGAARAYRQHLYEHAIGLSAIRLISETGGALGAEAADEIEVALYAADTAGAPVLCIEVEADPEAWPQGLAVGLERLVERAVGLRVIPAVALRPCTPAAIEAALGEDEGDPSELGLSVDVEGIVAGSASADGAYDLVRRIASHVRHVTCRGAGGDVPGLSADLARVAAILGRSGYARALTVGLPEGKPEEGLQGALRAGVRYVTDVVGAGP